MIGSRSRSHRHLRQLARIVVGDVTDVDTSDVAGVLTAARQHRVELMTLDTLHRHGFELPADAEQRRAPLRAQAQARRLLTARALASMRNDIDAPFAVVKGPVIAERWYDDPDHRTYGDLDVIVQRTDFAKAFNALTSAGWEAELKNWHGFARRGVAEVPLQRDGVKLDLHWALVGLALERECLSFDLVSLLERSLPVTISGGVTRTLDDLDTLIHLCVNTGLDGAHRFQHILDVDHIVARGDIDPAQLAERAQRAGAAALCAATLQRARTVFGTRVPDEWLTELEPWSGWLATNRLVDRLVTSFTSDDSIGPGIVLASGRANRSETLAAMRRTSSESIRVRLGGRRHTDDGGELAWLRGPAAEDETTARQVYLDWVSTGDELSVVRCRDARWLESALSDREPSVTPLLGAALESGLTSRRAHAYVIVRPGGATAGALVAYRWTVGRRSAYVALADPAAAVELAALIDRLGITDIGGFEPDLTPLRPLVTRWLEQTPCTAVTLPRGFHWGAPAPDTRPATRDDLNQVTNLMWRYAPQAFANRWLLRRRVTRAIDDLVLVIEDGDPKRIVGVAARDSITTKYHCWAQIAVDPAYRRRSHSWSLIAAIMDSGHTADVGLIGFVSATNPMPIPEDAMYPQTWFNVALSPPSRFHGEAALRVVLDVLLQLGAPAQGASEKAIRAPGASDGLITDRRTQHWWSRSNSEFDEN